MRFFGRRKELDFLEDCYQTPKMNAIALVGRRRIGKTTLIKKFIEKKPSLYIQFLKSSSELNLLALSSYMTEYLEKPCSFNNFLEYFNELKNLAKTQKMIFVFDEYPFICETEPAFSSILQNFIDHDLSDSLIILSGSSISMMEEEIGARSRPLFGRVHLYHLEEMTIAECREFYPDMGEEDYFRTYLTFGGVPLYYSVGNYATFGELLEETILKDNSVFHEEGENMINRELSPASNYHMVLDAISNGSDEISSISAITGLDRQTCTACITKLMELNLVSPIHPMVGMKTKPVIYHITDRLLSFHYFIQRRVLLSQDYESVKMRIYTLHDRTFEDQCARYLRSHYNVIEIGKWIGNMAKKDSSGAIMKTESGKTVFESTDIDIVAIIRDGEHIYELYCECKFTGNPIGFSEYNKLCGRIRSARAGPNRRLAFFSRYGFDERFEEFASVNGFLLFGLKDLLS